MKKINLVWFFSTRWRWYHGRMILVSFAPLLLCQKETNFEKKEKKASCRRGSIQDNLGINRHTVLSFILNRNKQNTNNNNSNKKKQKQRLKAARSPVTRESFRPVSLSFPILAKSKIYFLIIKSKIQKSLCKRNNRVPLHLPLFSFPRCAFSFRSIHQHRCFDLNSLPFSAFSQFIFPYVLLLWLFSIYKKHTDFNPK